MTIRDTVSIAFFYIYKKLYRVSHVFFIFVLSITFYIFIISSDIFLYFLGFSTRSFSKELVHSYYADLVLVH